MDMHARQSRPKSRVHTRTHSWCRALYDSGERYSDMYLSVCYHTGQFHCHKNSLCLSYSSLPPTPNPGNQWPFCCLHTTAFSRSSRVGIIEPAVVSDKAHGPDGGVERGWAGMCRAPGVAQRTARWHHEHADTCHIQSHKGQRSSYCPWNFSLKTTLSQETEGQPCKGVKRKTKPANLRVLSPVKKSSNNGGKLRTLFQGYKGWKK